MPNRVVNANSDEPGTGKAEAAERRQMILDRLQEQESVSVAELAKVFGVTQPRVSDLMRGKIELFGLDSLVNMLAAAGMHVEMRVARAA